MRFSELLAYYSKPFVQKELVRLAQNREIAIRIGKEEGYGNRPDLLQFPADVLDHIKKGATSFHCSEERWSDQLKLSTESTSSDRDKLRTAWDLVLDVDCPWGFEFSTIVAKLLINALKYHDIAHIGIKFSGNKGWHIAIPFEAFPENLHNKPLALSYPETPKIIAQYLLEFIKPHLETELLELASNDIRKLAELLNTSKEKIYDEKKGEFIPNILSQIDVGLMSPRHLFRMPYSLHLKSGLASLVINPEEIDKFEKSWAKPENILSCNDSFLNSEKVIHGEASQLLTQALDWAGRKDSEREETKSRREKGYAEFTEKVPENFFPPCIKIILKGLEDGKKRSLFVLLNFLKNANWSNAEIETEVYEWNKRNKQPLKTGYIKSQLAWHFRQGKKIPPPNCRQYYQELQLCQPDSICQRIKNPLSYIRFSCKQKQTEAD